MSSIDRFRPNIHFTPKVNWMNDPNGCIFHNGVYHLFYQHHPDSTKWGPMHWGHATSHDLLNWLHHPIAVKPDPELGAAFSGSVICDRDNMSGFFKNDQGLVAFYTTHLDRNPKLGPLQQQCLAYSDDQGMTWTSYPANPVVPNPGLKDFRDPKVFFHAPSEHWIMVVVAGQQVIFYHSRNLITWSYCGEFGKYQGHDDVVWECPDLVEMTDDNGQEHWVLFVSGVTPRDNPFPAMQYFIGHFDGKTFTETQPSDSVNKVDFGADFYAAQSFSGSYENDGRHIWIAWANYWPYANETPADNWRGMMSLPRELSLVNQDDHIRLKQQLVGELFDNQIHKTEIPGNKKWPFQQPDEAQCIELKLPLTGSTPVVVTFSNSDHDELKIQWEPTSQTLLIDRTGVSSSAFDEVFNQTQSAELKKFRIPNGTLDITLVLDRCSIEIIALDGLISMTSQLFPNNPFEFFRIDHQPNYDCKIVASIIKTGEQTLGAAVEKKR